MKAIYIDPSAASFKLELQKQGVSNLYEAENEVIDGIRFVNKLMNNGTLKFCQNCKNLIHEIQSYVWDPKSLTTGEDKPMKKFDHACVVGSTLVLTDEGYRPISEISYGKLINFNIITGSFEEDEFKNACVTRKNSEVYELELLDGSILCGTGDHLILTIRGYKKLESLTQSDTVNAYAAQCPAQPNYVGVKEIRKKPNEDVFCLATKKNGNFVANGIVVKNCDALRYALYTHFYNKDLRRMSAIELDNLWKESINDGPNLPDVFKNPNQY